MQRRGDRVLGPYADGRGRWRVVTITAGKRENSTCATREEAEAIARVAREEQAAAEAVTLDEAIAGYLAHLKEKGDRQVTIDLTERFLHLYFPDRSQLLVDLTPARAQKLYDGLRTRNTTRGTPPADATHQQALLQAQALLRWASAEGLYRGPSPAAGIKPVGKRNRGKPQLRIDEGRKWLKVALEKGKTQPGALMAATALLLGCRAGELAACTVRDLDDGGSVLWLVGKTSETNEPRPVEVPEVLRVPLLGLTVGKLPTAALFDRSGEAVAWWARRLCAIAKLEVPKDERHRFCAHSLRGMHATFARAAGATSRAVADTLGNSPREVERSYEAPGTAVAAERRRAQMRLVK